MFERYSERARRAVFFARYETSQLGGDHIETEHLLLGILREDRVLRKMLPSAVRERIRQEVEARSPKGLKVSTSVDLPLSVQSKRALTYGRDEADGMEHRFIEAGHLALGLLRIEDSLAADLLRQNGIQAETLREALRTGGEPEPEPKPERAHVSWEKRAEEPSEKRAEEPSPAPKTEPARRLDALVEAAMEHFGGTVAQVRLSRVPWTRLEAMGHLVDWASTHQQWLARALTQPKLVAAGYPRDEWVTVQRYSELSWTAVTGLWAQLNQLLVHVLRQIPEEKLSMPCQVGIERPIPLAELIERYVAHCDDIIGQVLARD